MAIAINNRRFLNYYAKLRPGLGRVGVVGRQGFYLPLPLLNDSERSLWSKQREAGAKITDKDEPAFADFIFQALGVDSLEFIDVSTYEGATLIHDMNCPIPAEWEGRFDTLIDVGSLEHMFNVPVALHNYMKLLKKGGALLLLDMPANNFCGHGFYQFSPELFFNLFDKANGFSTLGVWVAEEFPLSPFYKVRHPKAVGRRVEVNGSSPVHIFAAFLKEGDTPNMLISPVQNDYSAAWSLGDVGSVSPKFSKHKVFSLEFLRSVFKKFFPVRYFAFSHRRAWRKGLRNKLIGKSPVFEAVEIDGA